MAILNFKITFLFVFALTALTGCLKTTTTPNQVGQGRSNVANTPLGQFYGIYLSQPNCSNGLSASDCIKTRLTLSPQGSKKEIWRGGILVESVIYHSLNYISSGEYKGVVTYDATSTKQGKSAPVKDGVFVFRQKEGTQVLFETWTGADIQSWYRSSNIQAILGSTDLGDANQRNKERLEQAAATAGAIGTALSGASVGANTVNASGATAASATGCLGLIKGEYLKVRNTCSYPVVAFVCYSKQITGVDMSVCNQNGSVTAGSGYGVLFGGMLRPGETQAAGRNVKGTIHKLACNASQKDSYGRLPSISYSNYGSTFSCPY